MPVNPEAADPGPPLYGPGEAATQREAGVVTHEGVSQSRSEMREESDRWVSKNHITVWGGRL